MEDFLESKETFNTHSFQSELEMDLQKLVHSITFASYQTESPKK